MTEDSRLVSALSTDQENESSEHPRIEQLMIYPVKSCRGISLTHSIVLDEGLKYDRQWMIVDAQGAFLTQRECPEMARIVPSLAPSATGLATLQLSFANAKGQLELSSPVLRIETSQESGDRNVSVWKYEGQAVDCGHTASKVLSDFLRRPVRLVRFSETETRGCNKAWTGELDGRTYFSDGYPILILGQASVVDLAARMSLKVLEIERFRPNIVLSRLPAYEEDFLRSLHVTENPSSDGLTPQATNALALKIVKPCPRCPIPKVDPWTGQVSLVDPAAELATYRYHQAAEGGVLGMNALAYQGQGQTITVGQRLKAIYDF
jgi:uncharacterized protein